MVQMPSSNMHDVSIKDLMSLRLCLSGRIVWQRVTAAKKTQIVQDESEVCVSGSWFISGRSVLALRDPLAAPRADGGKLWGHKEEPGLNQLGDTDALHADYLLRWKDYYRDINALFTNGRCFILQLSITI